MSTSLRPRVWFGLAGIIVACHCGEAFAAPAGPDAVVRAVQGWLLLAPEPLGAGLSAVLGGVDTAQDETGTPLYHVITLQPEGYVVCAADTSLEPILAFSASGRFEADPQNPLYVLLENDLRERMRSVAAQAAKSRNAVWPKSADKWASLLAAERSKGLPKFNGASAVDDPRVDPFIQSRWNQSGIWGGSSYVACYNYYTPPYEAGNPSNYVCGCVNTCWAQIMRYFRYPTQPVGTASFSIWVDGVQTARNLLGGDGAGGAYPWHLMPFIPGLTSSMQERQAIGALCADIGVACGTSYESGGSSAWMDADTLKDVFLFGNAIQNWEYGDNFHAAVRPNLDARLPVALSLSGDGGHLVVCDGYGFNLASSYYHLNMGWGGTKDAWYNLPDVDSDFYHFTAVSGYTYNVYTNGGGEIISGRVLEANGMPVAAAVVYAIGGGITNVATTDGRGIYALAKLPSETTFALRCEKSGYGFESRTIATGLSSDWNETGNQWSIDIAAFRELSLAVTPAQRLLEAAASNGVQIDVAANVPWTAERGANSAWITIASGVSGIGNGTVTYDVSANAAAWARTGSIVVSGGGMARTCTVIQAAALVDPTPHLSLEAQQGPLSREDLMIYAMALGDVDADGKKELVVSYFKSYSDEAADRFQEIAVFGSQNGAFVREWSRFIVGACWDIVFCGDIDGDGQDEIVRGSEVLDYDGSTYIAKSGCGTIALGDADNDGEIESIDSLGRIKAFRNNAWVSDGSVAKVGPDNAICKASIRDCDNDGLNEVVITGGNGWDTGAVAVYSHIGGTSYALDWQVSNWLNIFTDVQIGDYDNDGRNEIVLANNQDSSIHAFGLNGASYVEEWSTVFGGYTGMGWVPSLAIGNVNPASSGNDVVVGLGGHCSVPDAGSGVYLVGTGMILFDKNVGGVGSLLIADWDDDGHSEIIAGSTDGNVYVLGPGVLGINPMSTNVPATASGGRTILVTANLPWTGLPNVPWLAVANGGSGSGDGTLTYGVAANGWSASRTGTIVVAGGGLARTCTVVQAGAAPSLALNPASTNVPATASGGRTISVTANLPWTAVPNVPWLTVANGGSGSGDGTLTYGVAANGWSASRTGTIVVAGGGLARTCTVVQAGAAPSLALNPASTNVPATASGGWTISVTANMPWTAVPNVPWLAFANGGSGSGDGTLTYDVAANAVATARTGAIIVSGGGMTRTCTVTQAAASVNPGPNRDALPHLSDNQSIAFTTDGALFWAMIWDYTHGWRESSTPGAVIDNRTLGYSMTDYLEVHVGYLYDWAAGRYIEAQALRNVRL